MSWPALVALTIAVGLVPPALADTAAATPSVAARGSSTVAARAPHRERTQERSKVRKKARKATRKKHRKKRAPKQVSRTPSRSSIRNTKNMPRGYRWPPSRQMLAAERACAAQLDDAGVSWRPAAREGRIVSAVTVADAEGQMRIGGITYASAYRKPPHKLDCQLALALAQFGGELHALGVREIEFGSIYRWTNVRSHGRTRNVLSRHALGIAMDINSVTDASGREIVVKDDYPQGDPLLLAIEEAVNASGRFRILLTPKNDPVSHHDHFHLEVAVDYTATAP